MSTPPATTTWGRAERPAVRSRASASGPTAPASASTTRREPLDLGQLPRDHGLPQAQRGRQGPDPDGDREPRGAAVPAVLASPRA